MHFRPSRVTVLQRAYTTQEPCHSPTHLFRRRFATRQHGGAGYDCMSGNLLASTSNRQAISAIISRISLPSNNVNSIQYARRRTYTTSAGPTPALNSSKINDSTGPAHSDVVDSSSVAATETQVDYSLSGPAPGRGSIGMGEMLEEKKMTPEEKYLKLWNDSHKEVYMGSIPAEVISPIFTTFRSVRSLGLPDQTPGYAAEKLPPVRNRKYLPSTTQLEMTSMRLVRDLVNKRSDPLWRERLKDRMKLPVMSENRHAKIIHELKGADVLIILGSTGSGKSTQVPQIILDYGIQKGRGGFTNVICTQPRRISATSVARRVAWERNEKLGDTIGHHVRFSAELPRRNGSVLYCTSGIMWKYLQLQPEWLLDTSSHIIIDEAHERSSDIDILLLTLRNLLSQRRAANQPCPKLILMSATINAATFVEYFGNPPAGISALRTSVLEVPGRLYPIITRHLEDLLPGIRAGGWSQSLLAASEDYLQKELEFSRRPSNGRTASLDNNKNGAAPTGTVAGDSDDVDIEPDDLSILPDESMRAGEEWNFEKLVPPALVTLAILHVLKRTSSGDVLVFLPGMADIDSVAKMLDAGNCPGVRVFKLHSAMNDTNDQVFESLPTGWRRLVLSTNIAETSITLPEVQHVIDTGTSKAARVDRTNGSRGLATVWIDQQSQQQRRGRAGRVSAGNYYALYTRARADSFVSESPPELVTADLTRLALEIKSSAPSIDLSTVFSLAPTPPSVEEVQNAKNVLRRLHATTSTEELTPLGRVLSSISRNPAAAKAAVLGILFRCFEPLLIAASMDNDNILVANRAETSGAARSRREFSENSESDIVASINAFRKFNGARVSGDEQQTTYLRQTMNVLESDCLDVSRNARQTCRDLMHIGLLPYSQMDINGTNFPDTPAELNTNSDNIPLIKALLAMTVHSEVAIRYTPQTWLSRQGLMVPARGQVNERLANRNILLGGGRIPSRGDMLSYTYGRKLNSYGHKFMVDTSMITPLMTVLMADGVSVSADNGTVSIDDVINMKMKFSNDSTKTTLAQKMQLILEFRKLLDRFQEVAFGDLSQGQVSPRQDAPAHPSSPGKSPLEETDTTDMEIYNSDAPPSFNKMFTADNPLRDALIDGLIQVLAVDANAEAETLAQRRDHWLQQEAIRERERTRQGGISKIRPRPRKTLAQLDHERIAHRETLTSARSASSHDPLVDWA